MRFWIREVSGWLLAALGLLVFYLCYLMLRNGDVVEAWPLTFIGIIVFRGGIHLLKVAVAARVLAQSRENLTAGRPARPWVQPATPRQP